MNLANADRDLALEAILSRYMNECALRGPVHAVRETGSTMQDAHALAAEGAPEGTLVYAARQTQGRGRLGRMWASPEGGAYCSIILRPQRPAAEIPQLSLVTGLAAVEGIHKLVRLYPSIRWPNDVLLMHERRVLPPAHPTSVLGGGRLLDQERENDPPSPATPSGGRGGPAPASPVARKLAGILVEARSGAVVVGIGINVSMNSAELPETGIALAEVVERCPHPHQVTGALWRRFSTWYDVWGREGFAPIREALRPWMGDFGRPVHLTAGTSRFEGTATDLDEFGRLVVRLDSGLLRAFDMGEVTLLR